MRYDYIHPFVGTTLRILDLALPGTTQQGQPVMLPGDQVRGEVQVVIGITGEASGEVILSMEAATALALCSTLLETRIDAFTAAAQDALAELGNMIAGNALSSLNDLGFDLNVNAPSVFVGHAGRAAHRGGEAMQIPLAGPCGPMSINLRLGGD